jgi:hypothetical protein
VLISTGGAFVLPRLESGIHRFEVSRLGYETYVFEVGVRPELPLHIELFVFIDEIERSWEWLQLYRTDQLYRIEFIRNCGMIRVFTKRFMERVADGRVRLPNSFVGECLWVIPRDRWMLLSGEPLPDPPA